MSTDSPPAKVRAAMPGTLAELSARTEYPVETVLKMIGALRREGVRVNATEDGISRNVSRHVDPEWSATTVYEEVQGCPGCKHPNPDPHDEFNGGAWCLSDMPALREAGDDPPPLPARY